MKRLLITGATGFLGKPVLDILGKTDWDTHIITSSFSRALMVNNRPDALCLFHTHQCDLLDMKSTSELIREIKPSHLMHLAWNMEQGKNLHAMFNFDWLAASCNLIRVFNETGGERIICAGSYYEQFPNLYGVAKKSIYQMLDESGLNFAWARIASAYGPEEKETRLVPSIALKLMRGDPAPCSDGNLIRNYIYSKDVATALVTLLESDVTGDFDIANRCPVLLREVIETIAKCTGNGHLIEWGKYKPPADEPHALVANPSKFITQTKWRPKYTLYDGIKEEVEYLQGGRPW